jgi:hypothetical protein
MVIHVYKLASSLEERSRSNTVIRGATVWRHLPANSYHTSLEEKHLSYMSTCLKVKSDLYRQRGHCRHSLSRFRFCWTR